MISLAKRVRAQRAAAFVGVDAGKYIHALVVRPRGAADSKPFAFPTTRAGFDGAMAYVRSHVPAAASGELIVGSGFAGRYASVTTSNPGQPQMIEPRATATGDRCS